MAGRTKRKTFAVEVYSDTRTVQADDFTLEGMGNSVVATFFNVTNGVREATAVVVDPVAIEVKA